MPDGSDYYESEQAVSANGLVGAQSKDGAGTAAIDAVIGFIQAEFELALSSELETDEDRNLTKRLGNVLDVLKNLKERGVSDVHCQFGLEEEEVISDTDALKLILDTIEHDISERLFPALSLIELKKAPIRNGLDILIAIERILGQKLGVEVGKSQTFLDVEESIATLQKYISDERLDEFWLPSSVLALAPQQLEQMTLPSLGQVVGQIAGAVTLYGHVKESDFDESEPLFNFSQLAVRQIHQSKGISDLNEEWTAEKLTNMRPMFDVLGFLDKFVQQYANPQNGLTAIVADMRKELQKLGKKGESLFFSPVNMRPVDRFWATLHDLGGMAILGRDEYGIPVQKARHPMLQSLVSVAGDLLGVKAEQDERRRRIITLRQNDPLWLRINIGDEASMSADETVPPEVIEASVIPVGADAIDDAAPVTATAEDLEFGPDVVQGPAHAEQKLDGADIGPVRKQAALDEEDRRRKEEQINGVPVWLVHIAEVTHATITSDVDAHHLNYDSGRVSVYENRLVATPGLVDDSARAIVMAAVEKWGGVYLKSAAAEEDKLKLYVAARTHAIHKLVLELEQGEISPDNYALLESYFAGKKKVPEVLFVDIKQKYVPVDQSVADSMVDVELAKLYERTTSALAVNPAPQAIEDTNNENVATKTTHPRSQRGGYSPLSSLAEMGRSAWGRASQRVRRHQATGTDPK